ncbi:class IV lanthionine synthetase LanL [Actinoallomurus rhizosphaericola]|uniref:class IV lanthionine synthetase LanL n=1 Tax=Actinoallomurus rhizosphaericola TaxID=2952536 RepID=UPI0020914186|nr:class IV lanthionine synthetase LanL [Actinoallomurus rhizosphaericola]MCO5994110.1 class IV lanthionine synthetase LanL [Actinoallomurus rhizosphaericola]
MAERVAEIAEREGREVHVDDTWVSVHRPGLDLPAQGWKLHVSARPGTLVATLDRVLPLLFHLDCDFKVARSTAVLRELNSGDTDPGAVGKAVTVYPPQDRVVKVGRVLAAALAGYAGPRVPSDRRVHRSAPVYYRYGPFVPQYRVDENGDYELVLIGPDGEFLPGAAGPEFRCPPWASDPFRQPTPDSAAPDGSVASDRSAVPDGSAVSGGGTPEDGSAEGAPTLGGRYRLTSGVVRGARGNVYRAEDTASGRRVVIKEARAYVGENADGMDLRLQIRNERRILQALEGIDGVPGLIDHFRHGEDEYLVITEEGSRDLNRFVNEHGLFADDPPGTGRDLAALATQLIGLLDAAHARGVVVRDLSPKNVVLDDDLRCTLVDFGNSRYDGFQIPGWTPGYSVPDQHTGRPSEPADDYFALGGVLFFAATGMHPIGVDPDPARNLERTLMTLAALFPGITTGVRGLIPRLLSLDPAERTAAAADLRDGRHRTGHVTAGGTRTAPPRFTPDLLDAVIAHTRDECVRFAERTMAGPADPRRSSPPVTHVYGGSAGLGMELLHHAATEDVAGELARWTARMIPPTRLPSALFFGRTGTELFLSAARRMLGADVPVGDPIELGDAERGDYVHGVAGVGAGHLLLADLDPRPGHLAVAAECARRLLAGEVRDTQDAAAPAQPGTGVATESGFAHGEAGIAAFLLAYHRATGDTAAGEAARRRLDALAGEAATLARVLREPAARPMGASWCQGLSGIVTALVRAARVYDDEWYLETARAGARACLGIAPQAWVVSQCCGLAGIGDMLIDVALATGEEEFWRGAERVVELMLTRSGGDLEHPVFPDNTLEGASGSWGMGTPGVLSFLRRLRDRDGARLWTPEWAPPR